MKTITLTKGYIAQIDDEDYERVSQLKWYAQVSRQFVYAAHRDGLNGPLIYLHKFVLGSSNDTFVDHKDHDTLNCQKENLRPCTNRQNQWNGVIPKKRSDHPSQYKGVCWENGKWRARIRQDGKKKQLGFFSDEWEAAEAYNKASIELHGEFACLNKRIDKPTS
jgi:hypothetical protein